MADKAMIDMHKKKADAIIIHCSDPRFQSAYRKIIDDMGHYYDLVVFPGASKAIHSHPVVIDNIKLLHDFHNFEEIHILNHVNCGAFGPVEDELKAHSESLREAKKVLEKELPGKKIKVHLVNENAELALSA